MKAINRALSCTFAMVLLAVAVVSPICSQQVSGGSNVTPADTNANKTDNTSEKSAPVMMTDSKYIIDINDVIRLDVWQEPMLQNVQLQVTPQGTVNVPIIGEMPAKGITLSELTSAIAQKLEGEQIMVKPKVVLSIVQMHRRSVFVFGAVQRGGEFEFKPGDRVLTAVSQAGYQDVSYLEEATLTHRGENQQPTKINIKAIMAGNMSSNYELQEGDVINIPLQDYAKKIYVMGQVNRPMMYDLKDKTTVLSALNLAGGPTDRASIRSTMVIRGNPAKPVKCDLSKLLNKADLSQDIELQAGDVVYVPETKRPDWNKVTQLLNAITSITYLRRYGLF